MFSLAGERRSMQRITYLGNSDENSDSSIRDRSQTVRRVTGVLHRFPSGLKKQPLLRIHGQRFLRRDIKKERVKMSEAVKKAAPFSVTFPLQSGLFGVALVKPIQTP